MAAIPLMLRGRKARTVSDMVADTLEDWGVDTIFGFPGDGINGFFESLRQRQKSLRFIQVRHEEAAAFMACAYAKYTGRLGVCTATSGPGAIHLLNGLYDAKLDGAPVLAITGQTYSDLKGSHYQQEVNLLQLYSDVTEYNEVISNAGQAQMVTDLACRTALARSAVAHINIPVDVQSESSRFEPSHMKERRQHTSAAQTHRVTVPCEDDLEAAVKRLNQGGKIVILAGRGALGARETLLRLAERLQAPIVKALLGKGVIPDDHPLNAGGLGLLGTRAAEEAMEEAETLLMVGTSFPYQAYLPAPGQAKGIQIDLHADRIGMRFPVEVGLVGDAAATLELLLHRVKRNRDGGFLRRTQKRMREWNQMMAAQGNDRSVPMKPQVVAHVLSELAPDDAVLATDSGTITTWMARHFTLRGRQQFACSGNLATMACGLPYAIAAACAFPKRRAIAFVGDGGFTMLMGEFATAVKYSLPLTVVVIKNNTLGQIKWEQMVFLGNPEYAVELQPIHFAQYARACGGIGITVEHPGELRAALKEALHASGPALVEAVVDPFEPPMPAKVKPSQMANLAKSLARGEPHRGRIALTIFRDKVRDLES